MKKREGEWRAQIASRNAKILSDLPVELRRAWSRDEKGAKGFPMNTAYLLADTENRLRRRPPPRRIRRLPAPRFPKTIEAFLKAVSRLVPDVYEYMYEESIERAFARWDNAPGTNVYEQICDAVNTSLYVQQYGEQALPSPRGNWLHRQILDLARAAGLGDLTNREMAQFFQDVCPCGVDHSRETLKKFRQRQAMLPSARSI